MFREIEPFGGAAGMTGDAVVLRHPDGSINFDAYREIAQRARRAAIASSVTDVMRALSSIGHELAGKAVPETHRHTR
ncbi:MAG TPA: hypothetical protein VJR30_19655 [Bradyrhizobium sp.]|nr:hypothetical protein [Bradyrhizobium sp.]